MVRVLFSLCSPSTVLGDGSVWGWSAWKTFLRHFEAALDGLGLYAYFPQPGELFDEMRHTPEDEDAVCEGKTIQFCIQPGIAKKSSDGGEDDVVIPAEVRLNP